MLLKALLFYIFTYYNANYYNLLKVMWIVWVWILSLLPSPSHSHSLSIIYLLLSLPSLILCPLNKYSLKIYQTLVTTLILVQQFPTMGKAAVHSKDAKRKNCIRGSHREKYGCKSLKFWCHLAYNHVSMPHPSFRYQFRKTTTIFIWQSLDMSCLLYTSRCV